MGRTTHSISEARSRSGTNHDNISSDKPAQIPTIFDFMQNFHYQWDRQLGASRYTARALDQPPFEFLIRFFFSAFGIFVVRFSRCASFIAFFRS